MKRIIQLLALAVVLVVVGALYNDWPQDAVPPEAPLQVAAPAQPAPPVPTLPAGPAIRHPLAIVPLRALPALDESDAAMGKGLAGLIGSKWLAEFFYPERMIRRIVATVDNLPRARVSRRVMPLKPVPGVFIVEGVAAEAVIDAENSARYAPYVEIVQAIDARKLVDFYVAWYPLFQQAYEDLGYPNGYFNDRLVEALDDMLAAPDLNAPVRLAQPRVLYTFADPALEARSAGQKILMRMGRENAARVKDKLRAIRREVALRDPKG